LYTDYTVLHINRGFSKALHKITGIGTLPVSSLVDHMLRFNSCHVREK